MTTWVVDETGDNDVDQATVVPVLDRILLDHDVDAEVAVILTNDRRVQTLNREYRDIDRPTDVLSFHLGDDPVRSDDLLGEIYISVETAARQALEAGRPLQEEIAHLAIHGVLHLLGHEHDTDSGYQRMRSEEDRYLDLCNQSLNPREN